MTAIRYPILMAPGPQKYHPIYGTPSFFIHPCRTADAMRDLARDIQLDGISYIMLWLGLVGHPVGLFIPNRLAEELYMSKTLPDARQIEQSCR